MMYTSPAFWKTKSLTSSLLIPMSWIWRAGFAIQTSLARPEKVSLPVICVGNITVGGTGKTPISAGLCQILRQENYQPCILTRGYGGNEKGPIFADSAIHSSEDIGDEALMLSLNDPVCISRDRVKGARFIEQNSTADIIIMDDGMQNPWLSKDLTLGVFDGAVGLGNQRVMPAGPLRQTVKAGLSLIDIAVINGKDKTGLRARLPADMEHISARLIPDPQTASELKGRRVLGFAGIGRPERFFETLTDIGVDLVRGLPFSDHHPYSDPDLTRLDQEAMQMGAELVTTHKDWMRLPPQWRSRVVGLAVNIDFDDLGRAQILSHLKACINRKRG